MTHTTLEDWIRKEAIPFFFDSQEAQDASIDSVIASLSSVELLGFGEALHGGEEILILRNRLFQRLVKKHGYAAIAIESSFPRARVVNDYIASIDNISCEERRLRIDSLLGSDSDWENQEALADPAKAIGLTPAAIALRIETEDLITELRTRRPELSAKGGQDRYLEALQYAKVARELLNFHAAVARKPDYARLLEIRDALMADNLAYIVGRERSRGKVLAFAHNSHLQRGKAVLPWYTFWPAGSHLHEILGPRYAAVGTALGASDANGISRSEAGAIEARLAAGLTALQAPALFISTHRSQGLLASEIASLKARSGSTKNPSYVPLTSQSFTDFDWLAVLDEVAYSRGGPKLMQRDESGG